jgi:hypothetical protein
LSAGEWEAICPAHEDSKPSLWLMLGRGRLIVKCRCGCETPDVVRAAGLKWGDLFEKGEGEGVNEQTKRRLVATYTYADEQGDTVFQVLRYDPKDFRQRRPSNDDDDPKTVRDGWVYTTKGVRPVLYRLPEVIAAEAVILVEGEKDADRLASLKLKAAATTCPMGAGKWEHAYTRQLAGKRVVILPDNDEPGKKHAAAVSEALKGHAKSVRVVELPGLPPKGDVSDWLDAGHTRDQLVEQLRPKKPAASPVDQLTAPRDTLLLLAVAIADGPDSKAAAAKLAAYLKAKGVL